MSTIKECILDLGLEAIKNKITNTIIKEQAKERLEEFLDRQQALNFQSSREEEIDFEGIVEYIKTDLIEDVIQRFRGTTRERGAARQKIMEKAVTYSSANTKLSRERTIKLVGKAVDILADFYRKKINGDLLFVTGEIENTIISEHINTRKHTDEKFSNLENLINTNNLMSANFAIQEISKGNVQQIETQLDTYMNMISAGHTLFPNYGFKLTADNKIVSSPLNDDAKRKYPEKIKITATSVKLGNQPIQTIDKEVLKQAYRHQLSIYIDIKNAKKYLGDILDPIQSEAEQMIGGHAVMKPPSFPPSFPCSILIGEETIVPYLLLRTKEILDDGTVILTNEEQDNFSFKIKLSLTPSTKKVTYSVTPHNPKNHENLAYRLFLKRVMAGETITMYALEQNEVIMQGIADETDAIENLDEEIDFLQKITTIEEYFKKSICIPQTISQDDYILINHICDMIKGSYYGEADKFNFTFGVTDELRQRVYELKDKECMLAYCAESTFTIFNQNFTIPVIRKIECVKIENWNRLKEKITVLDIGEQIKIVFIPGGKNVKCKYSDRIKTEEIEKEMGMHIETKQIQ